MIHTHQRVGDKSYKDSRPATPLKFRYIVNSAIKILLKNKFVPMLLIWGQFELNKNFILLMHGFTLQETLGELEEHMGIHRNKQTAQMDTPQICVRYLILCVVNHTHPFLVYNFILVPFLLL